MRFQRLDLNHLLALDALLNEQSVTRAAERLHLSQSAMSGILSRLREHFEDELLVQVGRKMVVTELGDSLIEPIQNILQQIRDVAEKRPKFDPQTSDRHFRIVASDYVIHVLMVEIVRRIAEAAPNIVASFELLSSVNGATTREKFENGEIDVMIAPEPYSREDSPKQMLFEEEYVCVVWKGSKLASKKLTIDRYFDHQHVIRINPTAHVPSYDELHLRNLGRQRKVAAIAPSFILLPQLVIGTEYLATVHSRIARYYAGILPIKIFSLPLEFPTVVEVLQWPRLRDRDLGCIWLRDLIQNAARELDQA